MVVVALLNWLADAGVLAASIVAVGAPVPWRSLLFAYGVGMAAASAGILPGGLGVVQGAVAVTLMGAGVRHPVALAAILVYRFISFWMVIFVGWLTYFLGGRTGHRGGSKTVDQRVPGLPDRSGEANLRLPVVPAAFRRRSGLGGAGSGQNRGRPKSDGLRAPVLGAGVPRRIANKPFAGSMTVWYRGRRGPG